MVSIKSLFLSALLLAAGSEARRPYFRNRGTLKGWDGKIMDHQGKIEEVTDVHYLSGRSLKTSQTYDEAHKELYRSVLIRKDGYEAGHHRFYNFMFRLAPDWEPVDQNATVSQFVSHRDTGANCGVERLVGTSFYVFRNHLYARVIGGQYSGNNCEFKEHVFEQIAKVTPGEWHKVSFEGQWEFKKRKGAFRVWVDGKKVVDQKKIATTVAGRWPFKWHVGLDMSAWHHQGRVVGSQEKREAWFDEIAVGRSLLEVDPDMMKKYDLILSHKPTA
ncbi:integral membrane protein [Cordyceps fumosorosea ARSEF 2679]|uniref:Integral membrane protein n=1 Tax=Cordyceps fumosorosea (strain ARSEF 2679) TaxID=1081104 RepID=A0A162LIY5_CORFA|nr:integral membrane protein [Cordyceps fumosorosea ARSEF 2679]OAA71174.1 integral membrane protein [Cordyceps fumosorosea ARSEF 2679]